MPRSSARSVPGASAPRSSGVTAPHSPTARVSTSPLVAPRAGGGGSGGAHASTECASTTLPHALATPNPLPVPRAKPSSLDSTRTASTPESDASVHDSPSPQVVLVHLRKSGGAKPSAGAKSPAGAKPRGAKTAGARPAAVGKSKASRIPVLSPEQQPAARAATVIRFEGNNNLNRQAEAVNAEEAAAAAAGAETEACNEAAAAAAGVERQCAESKAQSKALGRAVQHATDASSQASRRGVRKSPAGEQLTPRSAASHSPPLAARTGMGPPTATVSRPRSTPGSSHGSSHGFSHGSSGLRRPRAEPLLARGGGAQEPPSASRRVAAASPPAVEPATTRSASPTRARGASGGGVSSDLWANLTREVEYAKQRAERAERELLELRPRAAGLQAALEQAKRDMADAASVATLRHEEALRRREEERRGEEARAVPSSGPFALPSPLTPHLVPPARACRRDCCSLFSGSRQWSARATPRCSEMSQRCAEIPRRCSAVRRRCARSRRGSRRPKRRACVAVSRRRRHLAPSSEPPQCCLARLRRSSSRARWPRSQAAPRCPLPPSTAPPRLAPLPLLPLYLQ